MLRPGTNPKRFCWGSILLAFAAFYLYLMVLYFRDRTYNYTPTTLRVKWSDAYCLGCTEAKCSPFNPEKCDGYCGYIQFVTENNLVCNEIKETEICLSSDKTSVLQEINTKFPINSTIPGWYRAVSGDTYSTAYCFLDKPHLSSLNIISDLLFAIFSICLILFCVWCGIRYLSECCMVQSQYREVRCNDDHVPADDERQHYQTEVCDHKHETEL